MCTFLQSARFSKWKNSNTVQGARGMHHASRTTHSGCLYNGGGTFVFRVPCVSSHPSSVQSTECNFVVHHKTTSKGLFSLLFFLRSSLYLSCRVLHNPFHAQHARECDRLTVRPMRRCAKSHNRPIYVRRAGAAGLK